MRPRIYTVAARAAAWLRKAVRAVRQEPRSGAWLLEARTERGWLYRARCETSSEALRLGVRLRSASPPALELRVTEIGREG